MTINRVTMAFNAISKHDAKLIITSQDRRQKFY